MKCDNEMQHQGVIMNVARRTNKVQQREQQGNEQQGNNGE
jgi:hypothetical protein